MDFIELNNIKIPYQITKKNNKNTYFYFKKKGFIQINLARYQTKKDIIKHMENNAELFATKYLENCFIEPVDQTKYSFLGQQYELIFSETITFDVNHEHKQVRSNSSKYDPKIFKPFEQKEMKKVLAMLKEKHMNNPYVDIKDISLRTRYTTTRHGSCNARKKNININLNLIHYDIKYIEYVFLHEIAHLKHQNHSEKFYNLFEQLCPNYKQLKRELKKRYR